jgi:hypothetical protein
MNTSIAVTSKWHLDANPHAPLQHNKNGNPPKCEAQDPSCASPNVLQQCVHLWKNLLPWRHNCYEMLFKVRFGSLSWALSWGWRLHDACFVEKSSNGICWLCSYREPIPAKAHYILWQLKLTKSSSLGKVERRHIYTDEVTKKQR